MLVFLRHALIAVGLVAMLAGCGTEQSGGAQQAARLVVLESLPPTPRYTEGSVSFLRVQRTGSDDVIVDGAVTDGRQVRGQEPLISRSIEPGEYRLVSYQRPCQGNCEQLDPPADRCRAMLRLDPGATLTATIVLGQSGGCRVRQG